MELQLKRNFHACQKKFYRAPTSELFLIQSDSLCEDATPQGLDSTPPHPHLFAREGKMEAREMEM